jgi:hypothetical protein
LFSFALTSKYARDGVKGDRPVGGFSPVLRVDFWSSGGTGGKKRWASRLGRVLAQVGSAFGATAHAAVHDAFMTLPPYTRSREGEVQPVVNSSFLLACFALSVNVLSTRERGVVVFSMLCWKPASLFCALKRTEDDTPRASNSDTQCSHVHSRRGKRKENGGYEYLQHQHGRSKSLL